MSPQVEPHADSGIVSAPAVSPRRRLRGGTATAVGLLLVVSGTVGALTSSPFVWVNRLTGHPFVLGTAAAFCVGAGLFWLVPWRRLRIIALISCLVGGLCWGLLGLTYASMLGGETLAAVAAPYGPGRDYEVVVRAGSDGVIDPAWRLSIRQRDGLLAREWSLGCISGDATSRAYRGVLWEGRGRLTVLMHTGRIAVPVDTSTGKPRPAVEGHWDGC